jgi:hypothetical protein
MYVEPNFKTLKALRDAVASGKPVRVFSVLFTGPQQDGQVSVEGPHSPEPHKWYARVEVKAGQVVRVLKS